MPRGKQSNLDLQATVTVIGGVHPEIRFPEDRGDTWGMASAMPGFFSCSIVSGFSMALGNRNGLDR